MWINDMTNDRGYNLVVRCMWCFLWEKRWFNQMDSPNHWTNNKNGRLCHFIFYAVSI